MSGVMYYFMSSNGILNITPVYNIAMRKSRGNYVVRSEMNEMIHFKDRMIVHQEEISARDPEGIRAESSYIARKMLNDTNRKKKKSTKPKTKRCRCKK